jgi:hypothetical protein
LPGRFAAARGRVVFDRFHLVIVAPVAQRLSVGAIAANL